MGKIFWEQRLDLLSEAELAEYVRVKEEYKAARAHVQGGRQRLDDSAQRIDDLALEDRPEAAKLLDAQFDAEQRETEAFRELAAAHLHSLFTVIALQHERLGEREREIEPALTPLRERIAEIEAEFARLKWISRHPGGALEAQLKAKARELGDQESEAELELRPLLAAKAKIGARRQFLKEWVRTFSLSRHFNEGAQLDQPQTWTRAAAHFAERQSQMVNAL